MPPPTRSAYVHVPFCSHRCGYCNFTVVAGRGDLIEPYLTALDRELSWLPTECPVLTLFIGGGTPTQIPLAPWRRLLEMVTRRFRLEVSGEFSIEANPADVDPAILDAARRFGVTRISLGAQSFDRRKLQTLERDHLGEDIDHAVALAHDRFESVSLDLIFGLPHESLDTWRGDLQAALSLAPHHISTYGLTFEKGTQFWNRLRRGELKPLDEERQREMFELAIDMLTSAGYEHYEVSNFAIPGHRARHNEAYWTGREYYAAGPGAARYLDRCRETNHRSVTTYVKRVLRGESPVAEQERLDDEAAARERLVFGLRRLEGVHRLEFLQQTGFSLDDLAAPALGKLLQWKLLEFADNRLRLTMAGLMVSDSIWPELL